jgi:hypothetical protein
LWVMRVASVCPRRSWHVRYASDSDRIGASQRTVAMGHSPTYAVQQIAMLFDYLVSDGQQAGRHGEAECFSRLQIDDEFALVD